LSTQPVVGEPPASAGTGLVPIAIASRRLRRSVWTLKRRYAEGHLPVVHVQEVQEPPAEVDQTPGCRETPPVQGLGNRLEGRARDADSAQRRRDSRQTDSHSENAIGASPVLSGPAHASATG
jgi:hypothetical protein